MDSRRALLELQPWQQLFYSGERLKPEVVAVWLSFLGVSTERELAAWLCSSSVQPWFD